MEIRKYEVKDRKNLVALWQEVFPDDPPHNEPNKVIASKVEVDDLIFLAEHKLEIVGACIAGYDGHRGWLYAVAVKPNFRRQGIGASVIQSAEEALRKLGCIKINLQIRSSNSQVQAFYSSIGYLTEERVSMGKRLDADA